MPFWGWILLIACLCVGLYAAFLFVVHTAHRRLPENEPLDGDPTNITAPVPGHIAEADSMTARELEAERGRVEEAELLGGTPTPRGPESRRTR